MKHNLRKESLILLILLVYVLACKKSIDQPSTPATVTVQHDTSKTAVNTTLHPYPITPVQECIYAPNYGDSIVYPQPSPSNFYIYPQSTQGLKGTYLSWPVGLIMDSTTGVINLTRSQTGQRYDVAFVQYGTTDTCISQLIVAGTAYMDSVYVLSQSDTTSAPYFNANPGIPSPCKSGKNACSFDYFDYATRQGVAIDKHTGVIDLRNTASKIFGKNPFNGATLNTTIFYMLNDNSNRAP